MVAVAVDPNKNDLKLLVKYLRSTYPDCQVVMFTDPKDVAGYVRDNPIDVLYTETSMPGMTGFGLQAITESVQPATLTVFVTNTDFYAVQAIKTRAAGYIVKPVTGDALREALFDTKFSKAKKTAETRKN